MSRLASVTLALACLASPALAQESDGALPTPEEAANNWTIAVGGGYSPDYSGSDDYHLIPAAAVRGHIGPVSITTRSTYLYADVIPRGSGNWEFNFGPIVGVRSNRTGKIRDDVVALLPDRRRAYEAGAFAGISYHGLTNPYDSLSFRLDAVHDVGSAHESTVISPSLDFATPLSRFTYASLGIGADFVSNRFADYYFSVSPAEAVLSGLPAFDADGGMKSWNVGLLLNQAITGDLTGGLSVFGTVNHTRLVGDFKRTPIVATRGSATQWLAAAGLAYTW